VLALCCKDLRVTNRSAVIGDQTATRTGKQPTPEASTESSPEVWLEEVSLGRVVAVPFLWPLVPEFLKEHGMGVMRQLDEKPCSPCSSKTA
jgi:hypothetical protein